jgi:3-hydroxyisobutyrate dehydrogenase-like beta-hydroxyacid dehydrogenase
MYITRSKLTRQMLHPSMRYASSLSIGMVGLGQMGSKMTANLLEDGYTLHVHDANIKAMDEVVAANQASGSRLTAHALVKTLVPNTQVIISILPNDAILKEVAKEILAVSVAHKQPVTHISCSTVSPTTSRDLELEYQKQSSTFIAAPVFARPDGLAKRQASWMISGKDIDGKKTQATKILQSVGKVIDFGEDVGAANVVKLCGNFLIASSIESIGEAMALAEKQGVDRLQVMQLLSSTIFDCLIYKGYGQRVSERDHRHGGFSLDLGRKDVLLVSEAARAAEVPMPFLSVLVDRYTAAKARGRGRFDWSAIGLNIAEDAGIDVKQDVERNQRLNDKNNNQ